MFYEPLYGILGSRENRGQNNQGVGSRVGKGWGEKVKGMIEGLELSPDGTNKLTLKKEYLQQCPCCKGKDSWIFIIDCKAGEKICLVASTCLCVWVWKTYVVHYLVSTGVCCTPSICIVHHQPALCTVVHKGGLCLSDVGVTPDIFWWIKRIMQKTATFCQNESAHSLPLQNFIRNIRMWCIRA